MNILENLISGLESFWINLFSHVTSGSVLLFCSILVAIGGWELIDGTARRRLLRQKHNLTRAYVYFTSAIKEGGRASYKMYLMLFWIIASIYGIVKTTRDIRSGLFIIIAAFLIYELFQPVDKMFGLKSPYIFLCEQRDKLNKQAYKQELYQTAIQLKNLIVSAGERSVTSHYVIRQLIQYTELTKPMFTQLQSMNMKNEVKEAAEMFTKKFGDKLAGDFVYIIQRLDTMKPEDFMPMLDTLLDNFKEEQRTLNVKRQDRKQNTLFMLASMEILVLVVNFIVLIFINTISQINFI